MEATRSSEMSVLTRLTWHHIPEKPWHVLNFTFNVPSYNNYKCLHYTYTCTVIPLFKIFPRDMLTWFHDILIFFFLTCYTNHTHFDLGKVTAIVIYTLLFDQASLNIWWCVLVHCHVETECFNNKRKSSKMSFRCHSILLVSPMIFPPLTVNSTVIVM
jgi:hypothetical protein